MMSVRDPPPEKNDTGDVLVGEGVEEDGEDGEENGEDIIVVVVVVVMLAGGQVTRQVT
jgi:hypothetical protein